MIATLDPLDEDALVRILTEPKNALVKQFRKYLEMDGIALTFESDALTAIAREALRRGSGARALRATLEELLAGVMYDAPSRDWSQCVVTAEMVAGRCALGGVSGGDTGDSPTLRLAA